MKIQFFPVCSAVRRCCLPLAVAFALYLSPVFSAPAAAEMTIQFGTEQFGWSEYSSAGAKLLSESGYRSFMGFYYLQDGADGALLAYHGKLYGGDVNYDGQTQSGTQLTTTTRYAGMLNEANLHYRLKNKPESNYYWDIVGGVGLDFWTRDLRGTGGYVEEYLIGYIRAGLDFSAVKYGFQGSAGAKYPVSTWEQANLKAKGMADSDPVLEPGKNITYYASLGYRFDGAWSVSLGYDGYRFSQSPRAPITINGVPYTVRQPDSREDIYTLTIGYSFAGGRGSEGSKK